MLGGLRAFMSMGAMILTLMCAVWFLQRGFFLQALLYSCWTGLYFCYSAELERPFKKFKQQRVLSTLRLCTWLALLACVFQREWAPWALVWVVFSVGMASRVISLRRHPMQGVTFVAAAVSGCFLMLRVAHSFRTFAGVCFYTTHLHLTTRKEVGVRRHLRDLGADLVVLFLAPLLYGASVWFFVKLTAMLGVWCALVAAINMPVTMYRDLERATNLEAVQRRN